MHQINKVLVIDDDPLQLEILRDYLGRRGVPDIVCVSDGQIAANLLLGSMRRPDLVISDIHMPGFDGIELLNVINNSKISVPLIFISGAPMDQIVSAQILAEGYGLNVLGACRKPVRDAELDVALAKYPGQRTVVDNISASANF
jgi:CheY-like chemotaxis protein